MEENAEPPAKRKNRIIFLIVTILSAALIFLIGLVCFGYGKLYIVSLAFSGSTACQSGEFIHLEWISDGTTFRTYERFECVNDEILWGSHVLTITGEVLEKEPGIQPPGHIIRLESDDHHIVVDTDGQYVYVSEGNKQRKMIYELYPGKRKALRGAALAPVGVLLMVASPLAALIVLIRNRRTAG